MKRMQVSKRLYFFSFIYSITALSCNYESKERELAGKKAEKFIQATNDTIYSTQARDILKDFNTWWNYTYYHINLSDDFIGLNKDSNIINKGTFLKLPLCRVLF